MGKGVWVCWKIAPGSYSYGRLNRLVGNRIVSEETLSGYTRNIYETGTTGLGRERLIRLEFLRTKPNYRENFVAGRFAYIGDTFVHTGKVGVKRCANRHGLRGLRLRASAMALIPGVSDRS